MPRRQTPPPLRLNTAQLRAHIADTVDRVANGGGRIVLMRRGRPLAALVSLADLAVLEHASDHRADPRD
ncbi:MAG: type II toxin-antitoxin system Phd/YefM family antitoxin [Planctomycetes bacterium]|nr:type II toxin-antitoxin system Phd/YefM family antitoxin [Planctomycetota bacterium]